MQLVELSILISKPTYPRLSELRLVGTSLTSGGIQTIDSLRKVNKIPRLHLLYLSYNNLDNLELDTLETLEALNSITQKFQMSPSTKKIVPRT